MAPGLWSVAPGLQLAHSSVSQAVGLCSHSVGCSGAAAWGAGAVSGLSQPDTGVLVLRPLAQPCLQPHSPGMALQGSRTPAA